jgi:hypothetical protein
MPQRHRFYDPIIQGSAPPDDELPRDDELPPIRGVVVEFPGAYIAASDVSEVLARYALRWQGEAREALLEMARYFASIEGTEAAGGQEAPPEATPEPDWEPAAASGDDGTDPVTPEPMVWSSPQAAPSTPANDPTAPDQHPDVALVELYPDIDATGTVTYWNARPVNAEGIILPGGFGNINHDELVKLVLVTWPGKTVQVGPDATFDALWQREHGPGGFNGFGRLRPSPRRLFG